MAKQIIYALLFVLVIGLAQGQARGAYLAAYWDGDYPTNWAGEPAPTDVRDALETAGYEILDAAQLKTWMDARIADGVSSVVVICPDIVPDTVVETNTADCTLRKYLDAGGKIVFYADIPFWNQGNQGGGMTNWGASGATGILGFNAASATWDSYNTVTITDEGAEWGLTETWGSQRPTSPDNVDIVLATDDSGAAAAWVKHYVPGDIYGGFVRIRDTGGIPNVDDLMRLAEYGLGGNPYPRGPNPKDGALHEDTWISMSWFAGDFAVSHDVYFSDNFDDVDTTAEAAFQGNQGSTNLVVGFPGFPYPDGLVPGTTYYWKIVEVNEAEPNSPWEGPVWSFGIPPKTAYTPDPADGGESVELDAELSWTQGFRGKLHTVYFGDNFDEVNNATGGPPQGITTYNPGPLEQAKTYYWRVDEFDAVTTHKGNVWSFTTEGAVASLDPANGAGDVKQTSILTWSPGVFGASHEVYFGTDSDAVKNADTSSPEYKGSGNLGSESYDPGQLEWDTTYYWRIDEVNNANPDSPWTGILWSFTTANFLVVDDFESYNDLDPADPDSNRIFNVWIDGYDDPTNGSLVGSDTPPFAEQTIVHGGNQSLPIYYDNSVGYSEATLTLTYPRDWTEKGVTTLTIWFRGSAANSAETLYVALNGSAVVNHDNPNAAQTATWTQWNIDLQAFGINLTNVNTITLGFGNRTNPVAGGTGSVFFDDIRLYAPAP
ncbi:MAG TPA: hypothetical protein VMW72_16055 [Sedimentisphaerales bacterium]|nr:hypothetical protein [Sedimentisphaerales bacterium]